MIKQIAIAACILCSGLIQAQDNEKISAAYNNAVKLIGEHKYLEAEKALSLIIEEKSDYAEAVSARGTARLMLGKRIEACEDFEKAASLGWKAAKRSLETYCGKDVPVDNNQEKKKTR
jgi:tetratricopeptide (TPR) repeat protein